MSDKHLGALAKDAALSTVYDLHMAVLKNLKNTFESGSHNLDAWKALSYCREHELPIPEWVLGYLTDTASRLCKVGRLSKRAEAHVFKAVDVKGKELSRCSDPEIKEWIICQKIEEQERVPWGGQQRTLTMAQRDIAKECGKSWETVRKIHDKWKNDPAYAVALELAKELMVKKSGSF